MQILGKLWRKILFRINRQRLDRELAEEMEIHRDMMPEEDRRKFGNTTRIQEESRDEWSWQWLQQLLQDLSYGVRVLRRAPGFTLGAVVVLTLGVGVNMAEFQIFDALLFHRFNFRDATTFLQISRTTREGQRPGFPHAAVEFYRTHSTNFAWLVSEDTSFEMIVGDQPGVRTGLVSDDYFSALGLLPAWGRLLDSRDSQPGAPSVAVMGYQYWQTRWAGDPNIVGRLIHVNNKPIQIVGVVPYTFEGLVPRQTALFFPVIVRRLLVPGAVPIEQDFTRASESLFGKLKDGATEAAADAELTTLTKEIARAHPQYARDDDRIQGRLVQESLAYRATRTPAFAIFVIMVLLVLVSACANLGNMLLARGLARQREITIRMSVGASRTRIIQQLMTESFLIALLGAIAGVVFGAITARVLLTALDAPPGIQLSFSWQILAAAFALTAFSAILFGLPAALRTSRPNAKKVHLRQSLVGVQVAVSCLLLISSGVLARNGIRSASISLGFDYKNMVTIYPQFYGRDLPPAVAAQKLDAISTSLSALPGVDGVTAALVPPLGGRVMIESLPGLPRVYRNAVARSYFDVMKLPFVRGRTFLPGEPNVVILSESAARSVWPNEDPIGKTWNFAGSLRTVTGIVKDSGANLVADVDSIEAYVPIEGADVERSALILHTRSDPAPVVRLVPAAVAAVDEAVTISLMRASRESYIDGQRRIVTLIGSIGAVATALAAAGMFALVAFAVVQRRRELGIRIAIGAKPFHILRVLFSQNAKPTIFGAIAGSVLALLLARVVRSQIVINDIFAADILGFATGLACFLLVAALATMVPAARALRIDPSSTLREE